MDWSVSSGTLVEVYGQYVVVEIDGSIYGEIHLCEPDEEYGTRDYFLRDITQSETYESTGTVTGVPKNPSRAGFYSLDLDDVDYGWNWYGEVYFSKTSNGPQVDNVAVGDAVEICGNRYYYNDGRAIIDLITSDHYLKKKDSEPTQFYIRPACQDVNGNHLDDVSYEFVDYPTYKGTCDYSGYLDPPSHDFGTVPEDKTRSWDFDIKNCGGDTLTWSVSDDRSWIKVYPSSGSTTTETDRVTVTIDTYGLSPEECTGHITVTSDDGTKKGTIKVEIPKPLNQPPVANFIYSPSLPLVYQTITFDASDSTDPDGTITSYEWDFGDETTGSGKIITYSYEESKRYQVTLIVTDNEGAKSQFSIEIPVVRIYKLPGGIEVNLLESEYTCNEVKDFYDYEHYYLIAYPLKSVEMFAALARGDAIGALLALKGVAEMDKILKEKRDSAIAQLKVLNMPVGMGYFCWSDYFAIYPDQTTPGVAPYFGDFARGTYEFIDGEMQMLIQDIDTFYLYRPGAEYETIGIDCPVNATITDQYGRIISDDGTNEIQDADMLIIDETKIFYLPADLRYSVDIDAYVFSGYRRI
jgi:hypothetical protein